ncbi:hypothetical protein F0562_002026 [Nyssa sinensis]|uniref:Disease resistance N-terminal domain-containing protein n=1 Tax=Nyssa sinensis TaxID=561372 RepID=A0A5J5C8L5_9ASTE|nr:hypothetical protein F0562_002026 [Nyssa sinensis]
MANALLNVVLKSLKSLIEEETGLLWGVDKEMKKLSNTLSTIQAVLEDAELKQLQDKALQDWLRKLKHAAYAVDDILDECATEAIPLKSKGKKCGLLGNVDSSFLPYTPDNIIFRHKIGNKMKEITEKLDATANKREKFHLRELVAPQQVQAVERRQTGSLLSQLPVYGREEDKEKIVEKLVEGVSDFSVNFEVVSFPEKMLQNLTVLEMLKIGGFTKLKVLPTTLANLISLKSIHISCCQKLESLWEQSLPHSLQRLNIQLCSELKSVSLQHLSGLETLDSVRGLELRSLSANLISLNVTGFVSFPEEMLQNLTTLESLKIEPWNKLQMLPTALANLTSLKPLCISSWSELESLLEQGLRGLHVSPIIGDQSL